MSSISKFFVSKAQSNLSGDGNATILKIWKLADLKM